MQVQSSTEPPKKLAQGERPIMADGNEYNVFLAQGNGVPIEPVYATEGTPIAIGNAAILKNAPNPNAAKLFYALHVQPRGAAATATSAACAPSTRGEGEGRAHRCPDQAADSDPAELETQIETIKKKYEEYFGT